MTKHRKVKIVYRNRPAPAVSEKYSDDKLRNEIQELEQKRIEAKTQANQAKGIKGFFGKMGAIVRDTKLANQQRVRQNIIQDRRKIEGMKLNLEAAKIKNDLLAIKQQRAVNFKPIKYEDLM